MGLSVMPEPVGPEDGESMSERALERTGVKIAAADERGAPSRRGASLNDIIGSEKAANFTAKHRKWKKAAAQRAKTQRVKRAFQ